MNSITKTRNTVKFAGATLAQRFALSAWRARARHSTTDAEPSLAQRGIFTCGSDSDVRFGIRSEWVRAAMFLGVLLLGALCIVLIGNWVR